MSTDKRSMPLGLGERHMGDAVLNDLVDVEVAKAGWVSRLCLGILLGRGDVR